MKKLLERVLEKIKPSEEEMEKADKVIDKFVKEAGKRAKKKQIKAEVFVGGSSGKGTVVRRKKQDIDVFVRFEKTKDMIKLESLIPGKKIKIHGSRDYFKADFLGLSFEVVPVLKISKPEQAENITDLSYFHVSYVNNRIKKNPGLREDILLAKAFCFANNVYGAESYVRGFSGYSLELLIIYYKSFEKMIRDMSKVNVKKKMVIDIEKKYKGKNVLNEMNEAKLVSPIIFVDPTFRERNVLAGLSYETFVKFQTACKKFLKKPSEKFFFTQKIDKKQFNLVLTAKTNRQEGDIAGSKLWKFFKALGSELEKYFEVGKKEFDYDDKKAGKMYFKIKGKSRLVVEGPPVASIENVVRFKKKHKKCFIKNYKVYAEEKPVNISEFLKEFKISNKKKMKDMGIVSFN